MSKRLGKTLGLTFFAGALLVLVFGIAASPVATTQATDNTLTAVKVNKAPRIDGKADAVWNKAKAVSIPIMGGFAGDIDVTVKSVINGDRIYFLYQWPDDEQSVRRGPWVYEGDGKFKHVPYAPEGFNSADLGNWSQAPKDYAYEDKLAVLWNINDSTQGFNEQGCAVSCHVDASPRPLKYTNAPGEKLDLWHWKLDRTDPVGKLDDQFVDNVSDVNIRKGAGRSGDPGGEEYANNYNGDKTGPKYVPAKGKITAPPYYILDNNKREITAKDLAGLKPGDEIAAAIVGLPAMTTATDRADVDARGSYDAKKKLWTLEVGRKLVTGSPNDVQFDDLKKTYYFGVAVFDNAQIEHSWSPDVYKLVFGE
ncbi:MAG: ethylbenzene dehydrogenase-related protein [Syntrophothermus sp.]